MPERRVIPEDQKPLFAELYPLREEGQRKCGEHPTGHHCVCSRRRGHEGLHVSYNAPHGTEPYYYWVRGA